MEYGEYPFVSSDEIKKALRVKQSLSLISTKCNDDNRPHLQPASRTAKIRARKRRFSVYWSWSYPWEANRDVSELDNRFSTMTEVRRVAWPAYETEAYSRKMFLQGIEGRWSCFICRL